MNNLDKKPRKFWGSVHRIKLWLKRPGLLKVAVAILQALSLVARLFDFFS